MIKFSFNFKNLTFKQTEEGIFVGDSLFLSAFIKSITPCYHFSSYIDYRESYKIELIKKESLFPDIPLVLQYDKESPQNFLKKLKSNGLKSSFSIQDSIIIWNQIVTSEKTGLLSENPLLSSDHCGWIRFKDKLLYMTSKFAISMEGPIFEYQSNNPNAYILYDDNMKPSIAFRETMRLINLDFEEIMPIFITQILSLLFPIINEKNLYNIPGLFLSGSVSTGKTELALQIGTLFGNPANNDLRNFMILQNSIREFERRQKGFSDTTFILDDARIPKSQTIRQSTIDVIERCGRAAFDKSDTKITPIITGEPKVFNGHLDSLKSRFIEIFLNSDEEPMNQRKELIQTIKENPKPLRTCLFYFIKFICSSNDSPAIDNIIQRAQKDFDSSFKKVPFRSYDNLLMHYIGLSLFLYYGQIDCGLNQTDREFYLNTYKDALRKIWVYNEIWTLNGQVNVFIFLLFNLIRNKRFKIDSPELRTYEEFYPQYGGTEYLHIGTQTLRSPLPFLDHVNEIQRQKEGNYFTYGYSAIINMDAGFSGIYIEIPTYIPGCKNKDRNSPILLLNRKLLFNAIFKENIALSLKCNYKPLYLSEQLLIRLLAERGILCTQERNGKDKGLKNYCFRYPHWINKEISSKSVVCFDMTIPSMEEINDLIISIEFPEALYNLFSLMDKYHEATGFDRSEANIEKLFQDIRSFL